MSDQIDPEDLYKAAYRETQGQPVDAVGREPEDDDGFVTTSDYVDAFLGVGSESWKQTATEYAQEVYNLRTALAARNAELTSADELIRALKGKAERAEAGERAAHDAANTAIRQRDEACSQLTASRAECEGLRAALEALCNAVMADVKEAKSRLDAEIAKDAPVHPVSAFLTGMAIHVGKARAALSQKETGA